MNPDAIAAVWLCHAAGSPLPLVSYPAVKQEEQATERGLTFDKGLGTRKDKCN